MLRVHLLLLPAALAVSFASADSLVLNGEQIDNVYIVESSRAVYVCNPADGTARSLAKSDPSLGNITISSDGVAREALRAEYEARKLQREQEESSSTPQSSAANIEIRFEQGSPSPAPTRIPSSTTPVLRLKGEPGSASRIGLPDLPAVASQNASGGGMATRAGGRANAGATMAAAGGGARGGGGGGRGGGSGGQGTSFGFRNISDLFDSADDGSVGETPNPITGR